MAKMEMFALGQIAASVVPAGVRDPQVEAVVGAAQELIMAAEFLDDDALAPSLNRLRGTLDSLNA